ncbi:hypothetical protein [Myroides sp. DF42-4-2]|uniref:hypothetical protein n=1 Tax=unclassified Myroides TaxID=2642485 RepID=UPI002576CD88|nr:hypothetical protein [Myroides sp. DF42-4-2]MDM1407605.1 hypothetical protein [Myroides sp. DF42-4-2]
MRTKGMKTMGVLALSVLAIACGEKKTTSDTQAKEALEQTQQELQHMATGASATASTQQHKKGDAVPKELVCMVNDAYMGKQQLEVMHQGKMYYGCCAMCKSRIPEDESVRVALDPFSLEQVDKAEAYIVIIGNNGEVAYFKNEENYQQFVAEAPIN